MGRSSASRTSVEDGTSRLKNTFRALRHRNFRIFFIGQFFSLTGTWMQTIALSWLVYRMTGSIILLGTVGFASQIPVLLLSPIGGAFADRYDRKRILIASQCTAMVLAGLLSYLTLSGTVEIWQILAIASCLGIANAFDIPARQAFVADMVGRGDLINAIALNSSMFNGARIVGPALGGIIVAAVGEGWCFAGNSLSYVGVIAGLISMNVARANKSRGGSPFAGITEGFRYVATTAPIRGLMVLLAVVSLFGTPYAVLMPVIVDQVLKGDSGTLGFLMGASGIGALAAALLLASRTHVFGLGRWVAAACAGLGVCLVLFSFSESVWLSALILIPMGFAMMTQMASSNTLVQSIVSNELRGRVMSVYSMTFMGIAPIGALSAGTIADIIGPVETIAAGGVVCMIAAGFFAWRLPKHEFRSRRMIVAMQMTGGEPAAKAVSQIPNYDRMKNMSEKV